MNHPDDRAVEENSVPRQTGQDHSAMDSGSYVRFGAMIATATVVMYVLTYMNTFQVSHLRWSEHRVYMMLMMGAAMGVVMLLFMLGMYRHWKVNAAILMGAGVLFLMALYLVRTETTVQDRSYMSAMIPHHSIAILTSERSEISDVRVCELAVEIIEAQRREIKEMEWLIADIGRNGVAETEAEGQQRPVPAFEGGATRTCPPG